MAGPAPMLSTSSNRWPAGDGWVLQPKWDGFRVLIEVAENRGVRAWSRHGVSLTTGLSDVLGELSAAPAGSVFDGELVALGERDRCATMDFAAVCRAVLFHDVGAAAGLLYVGFDVLRLGGEDLRERPWRERDRLLRQALPVGRRIRVVESQLATRDAHQAIVGLGFEGTVLKRPGSRYRPGRQRAWRKFKARHVSIATVASVHRGRDGMMRAVCDLGGRRVVAAAGADATDWVGREVQLVYSRVDADGSLREVRVASFSSPTPASAVPFGLR